jgi:hypothetical protein
VFHRDSLLPSSLSLLIAQPTLHKLHLHAPYQIDEIPWPSQCALKYLNMNCCTLNQYCIILQNSPLLKTVILTDCDYLINYMTKMSMSTFALFSFEQVSSLTLEKIDYLEMDALKFILSLTPSLIHLQVTSKTKLFNEFQWEQFIEAKLPLLEKFQFYFSYRHYLLRLPVNPVLTIDPFKKPFWLNKGWFVTCDYIRKLRSIRVYSIPICISNFDYVPELDTISCSTHYNINNDIARMDNVHVLVSDMTIEMDSIVPLKVYFNSYNFIICFYL